MLNQKDDVLKSMKGIILFDCSKGKSCTPTFVKNRILICIIVVISAVIIVDIIVS